MAKKGKKFNRGNQKPQPRVAKAEVLPSLDMGYLKSAAIRTRDWQFIHFILAGGGTGSFVAQHVGRLMYSIYRMNKGCHLTIVDPDVVDEENVGRSLFCDAEIGRPKAEALATRLSHAWGLNISSFVGRFDESLVIGRDLTVLIGCVDKAPGRQALNDVLNHNPDATDPDHLPDIWWLDCGNVNNFGRALLGTASAATQVRGAFDMPGRCIALPGPAIQYPDLLVAQPEEEDGTAAGMSCAQRAAANLQSLNINAAVAVEAADMLTRLLVTEDLKRFACEVNLKSGSVKSSYATPEDVARASHKPVGHIMRSGAAAAAA